MQFSRILIAFVVAASLAACEDVREKLNDLPPPIFEDVGDDPHPPRMTVLGIGIQLPAPDPDVPRPAPDYVPPEAGLTVRPLDDSANTIAIRFSYVDAAADIDSVFVRDRDGDISFTGSFAGFPGTAGVVEMSDIAIPLTVEGPHRLEVWAEDLNGSRSEKTTFTITVELF